MASSSLMASMRNMAGVFTSRHSQQMSFLVMTAIKSKSAKIPTLDSSPLSTLFAFLRTLIKNLELEVSLDFSKPPERKVPESEPRLAKSDPVPRLLSMRWVTCVMVAIQPVNFMTPS